MKAETRKRLGIATVVGALLFAVTAVSLFTNSTPVIADEGTNAELTKKALLNGLRTCYTSSSGYLNQTISEQTFNRQGLSSVFTSKGKNDPLVFVPSQNVGNTLTAPRVSCQQLFEGVSGKLNGLTTYQTVKAPYEIGYGTDVTTLDKKESCFNFTYLYSEALENGVGDLHGKTNTICVKLDDKGQFNPVSTNNTGNSDGQTGPLYLHLAACAKGDEAHQCLMVTTGKTIPSTLQLGKEFSGGAAVDLGTLSTMEDINALKSAGATLVNQLGDICASWGTADQMSGDRYCQKKAGYSAPSGYGLQVTDTAPAKETNYKIVNSSLAPLVAMRFFTQSGNSWNNIQFTEQDELNLYDAYLQYVLGHDSIYGVHITIDNCSSDYQEAKKSDGYAVLNSDGQWCPLTGVADVNQKFDRSLSYQKGKASQFNFNMVKSTHNALEPRNFGSVVDRLAELQQKENLEGGNVSTTPVEPDVDNDEVSCIETTSLGWILCPTLELIGDATDGIYNDIQKDWLTIGTDEMAAREGNGIYDAWTKFRDFANIVFVIILAVVILSQVTGIGVSNYGVKKILPSLVMVAILVNLSFFVCQIAVDVSNIVGTTVRELFEGLPTGVDADRASLGGILETLLATFGFGALAVGGVSFAMGRPEIWLIPLLCALITAIIGVLLFFILLAVRKAGILVLVALSPLAIICYALPNTKNLFDKWFKAFKSLLVLYPVCGIIVGGGKFFSSLFLKMDIDSFIFNLVAMMMQVIPLFFIPSLVRTALTALGNIGTQISNFGSKIGRTATGAFRRSDVAERMAMSAGTWGRQHGYKFGAGVGKTLRRIPGVGGLARRFDNSKAGQALAKSRDVNNARFAMKYRKQAADDKYASLLAAGGLPTEGSDTLRSIEATAQEKYDQEKRVDMDNVYKNMDKGEFDYDSFADVSGELTKVIKQSMMEPENRDLKLRAQVLANRLYSQGPNGIDALMETMDQFDFDNAGKGVVNPVAKEVYSYLQRDGRFHPNIKANNPGYDKRITDVLNNNIGNFNKTFYDMSLPKTSEALAGAGDAWFKNAINQLQSKALDDDMTTLDNTQSLITSTLTNPTMVSKLKPDVTAWLNTINSEIYAARKRNFVQAALAADPAGTFSRAELERRFDQANGGAPQPINPRDYVFKVRK